MSKNLFITSIVVLCTFVPAHADDSFITNESTCNNSTLGSTESANLVAQWTPDPFTITYNCGAAISGSSSTPTGPTTATSAVVMDGPYTLAAANNCSMTGYTFAGWSCPNLPGTPTLPVAPATPLYFSGGATGTYSYPGNITCTAQWTQNTVTLHWNGNYTNAPSISDTTCNYDAGITLPANPTRTGYTFTGWTVVTPAP